ncbi:MAG: C2H2-type zinc finger protein [Candidatus Bathyarchaeota archaeon]|nr:MAG: C2H2-type zinc finger protein [Candidatus Bathyarchaeota archaeon]
MEEEEKIKGMVGEVGLIRDEERFNAFNLTISMVLKSGKPLTLDQAESMIKQYRKELLGKEVEISAITVPCPICGKGFNTEQGMKQHVRMVHKKKKTKKTAKKPSKKTTRRKKST